MTIGFKILNQYDKLHTDLSSLIDKWLEEAKDADAFKAQTLIDCAEQVNNILIASHKNYKGA